MTDISIRIEGVAGRITLQRPEALNAMTYEMCLGIEAALDAWRSVDDVKVVVIDAAGERAFCAGGDIAELYRTGTSDDYAYGQTFWADEYRLNHKISAYPKPVVSFLQGFTMGGGVGIGCHGSQRIVGETSQIAMPECGIGLVPDVGGTLILARAPGYCGEYFGLTGARMNAGDAIYVGFADHFLPEAKWAAHISELCATGDVACLVAEPASGGVLQGLQGQIDVHFAGARLEDIESSLQCDDSEFAKASLKSLQRNAPLSQACALEIIRRLREPEATLQMALELEYRFTARSMEHGDFLEGIRAQIIDKDRNPKWRFADRMVPQEAVNTMLEPLSDLALEFDGGTS